LHDKLGGKADHQQLATLLDEGGADTAVRLVSGLLSLVTTLIVRLGQETGWAEHDLLHDIVGRYSHLSAFGSHSQTGSDSGHP
jgi:hypothetical protein